MPVSNKKIKLCYVLPVYDPGADTHFTYLYDLLSRAGNTMEIFLLVERAPTRDIPIANMSGVFVQRFRFFPLRVIENFFMLLYARILGYSAVYVHYSYVSAWNASIITRLLTGKTYYWNCGMPWLFGEDSFLKTVLDMVHVLVTGTPRMADLYADTYRIPRKKIKVMPNWISLADFVISFSEEEKNRLRKKFAVSPDKKILLFVHRLSKRKGAHLLPEIISLLISRDIVVLIVGDGPERESLESSLTEMDLMEHVRMVGSVPNRELSLYYSIADLFLMPSIEEGFPHVLLEAMAYGVPFVATDVGGVRDIVPPAFRGYVVSPDDPTGFAVKAGNLLSRTPEEHAEMQQSLSGWVKQYDISFAVEKFEELFRL